MSAATHYAQARQCLTERLFWYRVLPYYEAAAWHEDVVHSFQGRFDDLAGNERRRQPYQAAATGVSALTDA